MPDTAPIRAFTLDNLLDFRVPFDVRLSPDGSRIAFARGTTNKVDKDSGTYSAIYLTHIADASTRLFIGSETTDSRAPRWSADNRWLAFTSNRANKKETQLYRIALDGGEAERLTDVRGSIGNPTWLPDGRGILFTYNGTLDKEPRPDPDPIIEDAAPQFTRVWRIDLETRVISAVTPADLNVYEYALSPNGATLALIAAPQATNEAWYFAQLYAVDVATASARQICQTTLQSGNPVFSPDNETVAFIAAVLSDQGYVGGDVFTVAVNGPSDQPPHNLTPDLDHTITWIAWRQRGILYGARPKDGTQLRWLDPATGASTLCLESKGAIGGGGAQYVSLGSDDDTFATQLTDFDVPSDVYVGSLSTGAFRPVTHLFPELDEMPKQHVESIDWQSPDGTPVQGFLDYPDGYMPDKRYPLVVLVHGGPSGSFLPLYGMGAWNWRHLLTARGCFVLMPNPRGSWGRGRAYGEANLGDLGGGDWQDIDSGVDALIARGLVDAERVGIVGWSYGGYMTAWAVTQTDRFKCAVAGAALINYESNYGMVSIRGWQPVFFGESLYAAPEKHRARSPLTFVSRVKTPTLLLHGEQDDDVPPGQSLEFYTALKHFGVPTQLVRYPREPHGLQERAHQRDMMERIIGWFEKYLLPSGTGGQ